jgi:hypothetical protein
MVERTIIRPPATRLGHSNDAERAAVQAQSPVAMKYDAAVDRESAYEILTGREATAAQEKSALAAQQKAEAEAAKARREAAQAAAAARAGAPRTSTPRAPAARKTTRQTPTEAATSTFMRTATRELTKFVFRGMFGNRRR